MGLDEEVITKSSDKLSYLVLGLESAAVLTAVGLALKYIQNSCFLQQLYSGVLEYFGSFYFSACF